MGGSVGLLQHVSDGTLSVSSMGACGVGGGGGGGAQWWESDHRVAFGVPSIPTSTTSTLFYCDNT